MGRLFAIERREDAPPRHLCPECGARDVDVPPLWQATGWAWAMTSATLWVPILGWIVFPFFLLGAVGLTVVAIVSRSRGRCDVCGWVGKPRAARKAAKVAKVEQ